MTLTNANILVLLLALVVSSHGHPKMVSANQSDHTVLADPRVCVPGNSARFEGGHCGEYFICIEGRFEKAVCSRGMYYDDARSACIHMRDDATTKCACVMPENSIHANGDDCSSYYYCKRRSPLLMYCPTGYYFSQRINACLPDVFGECRVTFVQQQSESLAGTLSDGGKTAATQLKPYPGDATKFYVYYRKLRIVQQCPIGMTFNSESLICEKLEQIEIDAGGAVPVGADTEAPAYEEEIPRLTNRPMVEGIYDKLSSKFIIF